MASAPGRLRRVTARSMAAANRPVVRGRRRPRPVAGRRVLVTGASSGIGRAAAVRLAHRGARLVLVARRAPELRAVAAEIGAAGGEAVTRPCDLTDAAQVDELLQWVQDDGEGVDVLVNNAGRSIRRSLEDSFVRPQDFERLLQVNFLGPVRLTLGLLPGMVARRDGHVVNVGTWTVPVGTSPRFAAYHSSKAALAGFGRCIDAELARAGVAATAVHLPLVHTAMVAPTAAYRERTGLQPEDAAAWIELAIERRPLEVAPRYAVALAALGVLCPRSAGAVLLRWG